MTTNSNMEEDIDILIDEIENEFKNEISISTNKKTYKSNKKPLRSEISIDVDDLLTLDLSEPWSPRTSTNNLPSRKSVIKCFPTFIGNSNFPLGCTKPGITRTCSALFCSNCDFKVSQFLDYEWIEDVDYMFLRTNMPSFDKLQEKLKCRKGSCAYGCQCVTYSSRTLLALHAVPSLPWFCRGHSA